MALPRDRKRNSCASDRSLGNARCRRDTARAGTATRAAAARASLTAGRATAAPSALPCGRHRSRAAATPCGRHRSRAPAGPGRHQSRAAAAAATASRRASVPIARGRATQREHHEPAGAPRSADRREGHSTIHGKPSQVSKQWSQRTPSRSFRTPAQFEPSRGSAPSVVHRADGRALTVRGHPSADGRVRGSIYLRDLHRRTSHWRGPADGQSDGGK